MTPLKPEAKTKALLKILIGAAWLDGEVQMEEREYLRAMAKSQNLDQDPEIRPLLYELVQVQPNQCYQWVENYLGNMPSQEDCQSLIEALSGLIYSDGSVEVEEAKLLTHVQEIQAQGGSIPKVMLKSVQQLDRRWVGEATP